ncbi:MAG: glycosyltransferase [Clostridiales bacterium]|nr:glycosyltransferase [Clostridiales bacterium]
MRKILMVCEAFGGGVFTYVSQLCNDMCEDFDVYLAYAIRPQTPENYKDFLDKRVHLIEVKNFSAKGLTNIANDIKVIKELRAIEEKVKPDVIHLHSSVAGGIGRLAFKGKKNTVVYTPHGYAHILMGSGAKCKMYGVMEHILGRISNAITLTCCESEDEVAKGLTKRTAYIETGVNLADLSASLDGIEPIKNEKFTVFTLGRACVQKQPQLFNRIAELVPEARFVWIGNGELENLLTAPNMEVTGWKPRKEALAMAKGADAFILCSLGEAIAMSLIENMYIKKLILVSDVMGNKSVIHDGVNGYVCNTAEEYAEKIKAAMEHFPSELPERAYQDVLEIYNTESMKKKYVKFYSEQIGGGGYWLTNIFVLNGDVYGSAGEKAVA